jgi:hypothetical protein
LVAEKTYQERNVYNIRLLYRALIMPTLKIDNSQRKIASETRRLEAKLLGLQLKIGEKYYGRNSRRGKHKKETLIVLNRENKAAT